MRCPNSVEFSNGLCFIQHIYFHAIRHYVIKNSGTFSWSSLFDHLISERVRNFRSISLNHWNLNVLFPVQHPIMHVGLTLLIMFIETCYKLLPCHGAQSSGTDRTVNFWMKLKETVNEFWKKSVHQTQAWVVPKGDFWKYPLTLSFDWSIHWDKVLFIFASRSKFVMEWKGEDEPNDI